MTGTETVDGRTVYIVESVLADDSGNLLKTLEVEEYREIDGFRTIKRVTMTSADSGHATTMELADLRFNTGIEESTFTERTMTRGIR
ncbi:MAG: outer membrane lipoprotein-sorting protein [Spirochaetota bacterium]